MNYTKGEWEIWKSLDRVPPEGAGFWAVYVVDDKGGHIAKVSRTDTETTANAHLIVAAPEMYEALRDAQYWFTEAKAYIPLHSATLGTINQALAKAEGK